jgi:excisionase family DNA binding protein
LATLLAGYPLRCPATVFAEREVGMEDKDRKNFTVAEAAEYLDLSRTTVQEMVDRGQLKADRFAGAVHIPREEVERIERETAP